MASKYTCVCYRIHGREALPCVFQPRFALVFMLCGGREWNLCVLRTADC